MSEQIQVPGDPNRPGQPQRPPITERVTPGPAPVTAPLPGGGNVPPVSRIERKAPPPEVKDGFREIVVTIVFVVVLVLLLKTFQAEAFVIPTGSMATTLLGYHKDVVCEKCRFPFKVNASDEVEKRPPDIVVEWTCPNCRFHNRLQFLPRQQEE